MWSVIGFKPETVLPRFINALPDAVRGGRGPGRVQRLPDRHRPGDRPGHPDRADPAPRRGLMATSGRRATRRDPRTASRSLPATRSRTSTPTRPARTASSSPPELVRQAVRRRASGCSPIADHDNLAGYRELVAPGAPPLPAGPDARPGRRDQRRDARPRPRPVRGRAPRAGDRRRPDGRGVRGRPRGPARRPPHRASTRPSSGCARSGCRSTPRSRPSTSPRTTRSAGRPSPAPSSPPGSPRASRTRSGGSSSYGQPGYVPRTGLGAGRGDPRDPCRRRPRLARALLGGAGPDLAPARPHRRGPRRPRDPPPLVRRGGAREDRGHGARARPRRDRRHGLPRRPGPVRARRTPAW